MSKLEVVFALGLAHPLLMTDSIGKSASVLFSETGNMVKISFPHNSSWPDGNSGVFDVVLLRVMRDCSPEDCQTAQSYATLQKWGIINDAATALGRVLGYIRDEDFIRTRTVAGYPAVISDSPQSNPAVQVARAEVFFDGNVITTLPLSGVPSIRIELGMWDRVCERLQSGKDVPVYRSFLLDAYYFATSGDPLRAIVMACAAWETGLRHFLSSSGATNLDRMRLPQLSKLVQQFKGKTFFDDRDAERQAVLTDVLVKLPRFRNELLHEGKKNLAQEDIVEMTLAVDEAIGWLFGPFGATGG